jgi:Glycosyl transferase family 90
VIGASAVEGSSTPAAAVYAQLRESFSDLASNGVTARALDDFQSFLTTRGALARESLIVRCRIADGRCDTSVVVDKRISRERVSTCFMPFLDRVLPRTRGRSEFFALVSDKLYVEESAQEECLAHLKRVPFLRCDRSPIDPLSMHTILIPDYFMQHPAYARDLDSIRAVMAAIPFERREDTILWRGSLTGEVYPNIDNYRQFPRYKLTRLSVRHREVLDARFTNYDFGGNAAGPALSEVLEGEFGPPAEFLPASRFVRHKYLISLDGAGAAWKRVATILASGSVLLLHNRWDEFFYPGLEPWVHYVPVDYDLSDVLERHGWLTRHPPEAAAIARNGLRFARETLSPEVLETYFATVVNTCGELYR